MTITEEFVLIFGMMLVTFGARYPLMALAGKVELPEPVVRALAYVPVAVLTAISVPMVLKPSGSLELTFCNPYLTAALVAIAVAWFSRHLLATISIGFLVFMVLRVFVVCA